MTAAQLRARRSAAQGLHPAAGGPPEAIVGRLLAVQAQDLRAARLGLRARAPDAFLAEDVDAALRDGGPLVVAWLMRSTLHLVRREDHAWLLALTAPTQEAGTRRRLGQLGVSPDAAERAVAIVERALADEGPLPRAALADRMAAKGIPTEGQATPHLIALAARRVGAVLVVADGGEPAFALSRERAPRRMDRDAALAELARRWLTAHGPATDADLAAWAGLPLRDARAGLAAISRELREEDWRLVDLAERDGPPRGRAPARLLPAFDPYLLGWHDRGFAVPRDHAHDVHPGGGILRAVATDGGRVVGTWTARRRGGRLAVAVSPFARLSTRAARALERDAADVARFEGLEPA